MSFQPRIPIKFSKADDSETFVFPTAGYSFEAEGSLRAPEAMLTGGHGGLDLLGAGTPVKDSGLLRLAFEVIEDTPTLVEVTVDDMLDKLFRYGRGKLYTEGLESGAETLRWTRARMIAMPRINWSAGEQLLKRAVVAFRHDPFWYDDVALYASPVAISTNPQTVVVTNTGNARIYGSVLTAAGTFSGLTITNTTNGYRLKTDRTGASAADLVRFDAAKPAVDFSSDTGGTWSGDYANFLRRSGQVQLMVFEPGANSLSVAGLSGTLTIDAYPAFH